MAPRVYGASERKNNNNNNNNSLSEGNFDNWLLQMTKRLRNEAKVRQWPWTWMKEMMDDGSGVSNPDLRRWQISCKLAELVRTNISPSLLNRVPEKDRKHLGPLLTSLRGRFQPFRFLDLPEGMRARVYTFLPSLQKRVSIEWDRESLPAICHTSRTLRKETRRLFFAHSMHTLSLRGRSYCHGDRPAAFRRYVMRWTTEAAQEHSASVGYLQIEVFYMHSIIFIFKKHQQVLARVVRLHEVDFDDEHLERDGSNEDDGIPANAIRLYELADRVNSGSKGSNWKVDSVLEIMHGYLAVGP